MSAKKIKAINLISEPATTATFAAAWQEFFTAQNPFPLNGLQFSSGATTLKKSARTLLMFAEKNYLDILLN